MVVAQLVMKVSTLETEGLLPSLQEH